MKLANGLTLILLAPLSTIQSAYAWYGPICYPDSVRQIILTQPPIAGEAPGDLEVTFDDNADQVVLTDVRPSKHLKGAHEIVLTRDEKSNTGNFALVLTSPRTVVSYKYEFEIRMDATECHGAIIHTSNNPAGSHAAKSFAKAGTDDDTRETLTNSAATVRQKPAAPKRAIAAPTNVTGSPLPATAASAAAAAAPAAASPAPTQPSTTPASPQPAQPAQPAQPQASPSPDLNGKPDQLPGQAAPGEQRAPAAQDSPDGQPAPSPEPFPRKDPAQEQRLPASSQEGLISQAKRAAIRPTDGV